MNIRVFGRKKKLNSLFSVINFVKLTPIALCLSIPLSASAEDENDKNVQIWANQVINSYDYLGDGKSSLDINGLNIGLAKQFGDHLSFSISYGDSDAKDSWPFEITNGQNRYNQAEIESKSANLSLSWMKENYDVTFNVGRYDSDERGLTHQPAIVETIKTVDDYISVSYDKFNEIEAFVVSWSIGLQYASTETKVHDAILTEPVTHIGSLIQQDIWSSYLDVSLSYWIESESVTWAPNFMVSWNAEISADNEQISTVIRDGERRPIPPSADYQNNYLMPDSGYWEAGVSFEWPNNFGMNISYGETFSAQTDLDNLSIGVSYSF